MGSCIHVCFTPPAQSTLFIEAIQLFFYRVGVAKLSPYTRLVYQNQCEAQNGHNWQDAAFGPQIFQNDSPQFFANPLCGPNTVFQGRWPNQGGTPQDPPKKRQSVAQAAFWS